MKLLTYLSSRALSFSRLLSDIQNEIVRIRKKNIHAKSMSVGRQSRLPSVEEIKGPEAEALKKIGRFAVSPPLIPDLTMRRSGRARRGSTESNAVISKMVADV